ncbi:hypothetical protein Uis1B_1492 [Bifidobacterium margollesii]|uniref:Uncharacterized protein n=1 Tax=Bifidobacterium margollesii TaxID=2020964 RepID=A0A2N5J904_9BIFI|nr:hypothetical protein Uis1B_1492 [Bifidobacterium margollesii]
MNCAPTPSSVGYADSFPLWGKPPYGYVNFHRPFPWLPPQGEAKKGQLDHRLLHATPSPRQPAFTTARYSP